MLESQRDHDREKARLMLEEGLTRAEADARLKTDVQPARPAFPKGAGQRSTRPKTKPLSLYDRVRAFHEKRDGN